MGLVTTLGTLDADELGIVLPHEHVFVDLRPWDQPGYAEASPADVVRLMTPEIERARAAGVTAIVECSAVGVGRRADILGAVSEATCFPLVVPTGIYREPWIPQWAHDASEDKLVDWMASELEGEVGNSGVRAGWIKTSAGDDGMTACEAKILRAAARAATRTGAVIGSHTVRGSVVDQQLDVVVEAGCSAERFIWIHTQAEPDLNLHLKVGRRGAWLEYDWIGGEGVDDDILVEKIVRLLDAGLVHQLLLSQDRGWYDPAQRGGGTPRPYTYLMETFLPKLRAAGVDDETVRGLIVDNPYRAFSR